MNRAAVEYGRLSIEEQLAELAKAELRGDVVTANFLDRVTVKREARNGQPGWVLRADGTFEKLFAYVLPEGFFASVASQSMASWNQVRQFLQEMAKLRESA
jgi:hypothetical protein